tara:strand:- start:743 stop:1030 length:288 start_codon:yes stop_codon:yes gene_type:complete
MPGRTMKYYKSAKGKSSYKKKLKQDVKRSTSKEGLKKRAELKRIRNKAKKQGKDIVNKDYDHKTKKFVKPSVNRGRTGEGARKKKVVRRKTAKKK